MAQYTSYVTLLEEAAVPQSTEHFIWAGSDEKPEDSTQLCKSVQKFWCSTAELTQRCYCAYCIQYTIQHILPSFSAINVEPKIINAPYSGRRGAITYSAFEATALAPATAVLDSSRHECHDPRLVVAAGYSCRTFLTLLCASAFIFDSVNAAASHRTQPRFLKSKSTFWWLWYVNM